MLNSKISLDLKSLLTGAIGCLVILFFFSFNKPMEDNSRRYQGSCSERGFLILDTYTGEYILDSEVNYLGKMKWVRGDFNSSFSSGVDKTGSKK